jgi:hypothetical protein
MNQVGSDATGVARTGLSAQAGYNHDVPQHQDAGGNQSALQPGPTVSPADARQAFARLSLFLLQLERGPLSIPGALSDQRSASQPVLRGLETSASVHAPGNRQREAQGSGAPQQPGPTLDEQAAGYAGSTSVNQGSDPAGVQAALDNAYRSALTAWVQSADANEQAAHREAEKRINAYLAAPPKQRERIDLSRLKLSTLPLLPAELIALDVSHNKLTALPANLPQGLQELDVVHNKLTALPAHLPQGLQELYVS